MADTITLPKTTFIVIIAILVAISAFALGYVIGGRMGATGAATGNTQGTGNTGNTGTPQIVKLSLPSFVPFEGSDTAKISIVEFGDYQCPFCERFFTQTEPQITQNYVDSGKAKFYFLDFAFLGPDSQTLAEGAWCANDQSKYYVYHDYIYSHQGQESSGWATPDKLKVIVANINGIDTATFNSCLDSNKYQSRVQQLTQLGQSAGVSGTPAFLVGTEQNGFGLIVGACDYSGFKTAIDAQLAGKSWYQVPNSCTIQVS